MENDDNLIGTTKIRLLFVCITFNILVKERAINEEWNENEYGNDSGNLGTHRRIHRNRE